MTIIVSMIFIVGLATVTAYAVKDKITQSQLDALDINELNLSEHYVRDGDGDYVFECKSYKCNFKVEYLGLVNEKDENGTREEDHTFKFKTKTVRIDMKKYTDLRTATNLTYAISKLQEEMDERSSSIVNRVKREISDKQIKDLESFNEIVAGLR